MLYNSDQTVSSGSYHKAIHGIYLRAILSTTSQPSRYVYLLPLKDLKYGFSTILVLYLVQFTTIEGLKMWNK